MLAHVNSKYFNIIHFKKQLDSLIFILILNGQEISKQVLDKANYFSIDYGMILAYNILGLALT